MDDSWALFNNYYELSKNENNKIWQAKNIFQQYIFLVILWVYLTRNVQGQLMQLAKKPASSTKTFLMMNPRHIYAIVKMQNCFIVIVRNNILNSGLIEFEYQICNTWAINIVHTLVFWKIVLWKLCILLFSKLCNNHSFRNA